MKAEDVEKAAKNIIKSNKKIAAATKDIALGKFAVAVIAKEGEISVASLRALIIKQIESSPSFRGERKLEQDLPCLTAQAALEYLESLLNSHAG